jgi:drug/metabolite transporter (DMT)-like permease
MRNDSVSISRSGPNPMSPWRVSALTTLAMLAFAGNSLLCRAALDHTRIDAASFTTIRLLSGAIVLWVLVRMRGPSRANSGGWVSAFALFAYAAGFSFAYLTLPAATGALLLFGAVQTTMIAYGLWRGERLAPSQWVGLTLALSGLVLLLLPGLAAPPLRSAGLMLCAGFAWGVYSLRGRSAGDPLEVTAGNFLRALPFSLMLSLSLLGGLSWDGMGVLYAVISGALTSGLGYAIWYAALPALKSTHAAAVQLSVPLIAAIGAVLLLGEAATLRLLLALVAIVGGIALVILRSAPRSRPS